MAAIKPSGNNPHRKKQILLAAGVSSIVLAIVLIAAYFAEKNAGQAARTSNQIKDANTVSMAIPGQQLNDKDVWRANEGSKIQALRKELEDMKGNIQKSEMDKLRQISPMNNGNLDPRTRITEVPMPPPPLGTMPSTGRQLQPIAGNTLPNPPATVAGAAPVPGTQPQQSAPPIQKTFSLEVSTAEHVAKNDVTKIEAVKPVSTESEKDAENYLPAGTFMRVVMLAGLDAPTGGQAQSNPHPVLFRVLDPAQLPNRFQANLKDCVVTGNSYGDISSERAYMRLDRMSCIDEMGGAIDVGIKGYVAGEDGKAGVRGRLVSKQGQALANAFLAGIGSGMGQAFRDSATTTSQSALGATQTVNGGQEFQAGLATGVGNAMNMLAKYYIKLAEQIFPVIEVDGGRVVDVVLTKGISIERQ